MRQGGQHTQRTKPDSAERQRDRLGNGGSRGEAEQRTGTRGVRETGVGSGDSRVVRHQDQSHQTRCIDLSRQVRQRCAARRKTEQVRRSIGHLSKVSGPQQIGGGKLRTQPCRRRGALIPKGRGAWIDAIRGVGSQVKSQRAVVGKARVRLRERKRQSSTTIERNACRDAEIGYSEAGETVI